MPHISLKDILSQKTVGGLRALADLLPERAACVRKSELIAHLDRLLHGEALLQAWGALDRAQQAAVTEALYDPQHLFQEEVFKAKYGEAPRWRVEIVGRRGRALALTGLNLFLHRTTQGTLCPFDLARRLRAHVPAPPLARLDAAAHLPADEELVVHETERAALFDLLTVLHMVDHGDLHVTPIEGRPTVSSQEAIRLHLHRGDFYSMEGAEGGALRPAPAGSLGCPGGDDDDDDDDDGSFTPASRIGPMRAYAWPMLLRLGGLLGTEGRPRLSKEGQEALLAPAPRTLKRLVERWLLSDDLDELARIPAIRGQDAKGRRGLTPPSSRREKIREALRRCPRGQWVEIDALSRYMRADRLDFEVTHDPWRLFIRDERAGSLGYEGMCGWHVLQGPYLRCVLLEYAATLGLIDVALRRPEDARDDFRKNRGTDSLRFLSRYDGLRYLRLTPLGAYCLGLTDHYREPASPRSLRVLPNLEIVVTETLHPGDAQRLSRYAERRDERVFRLTAPRLLEVLEDGVKLRAVEEFLRTRSGAILPCAVTRLLRDVEERAGKLRDVGRARLIECADEALAAYLAHDRVSGPLCLRAGARCVVVREQHLAPFVQAVRQMGHLVAPAPGADGGLSIGAGSITGWAAASTP